MASGYIPGSIPAVTTYKGATTKTAKVSVDNCTRVISVDINDKILTDIEGKEQQIKYIELPLGTIELSAEVYDELRSSNNNIIVYDNLYYSLSKETTNRLTYSAVDSDCIKQLIIDIAEPHEVNFKKWSGGGTGGTSDYRDLENKPSINGKVLIGNKSSADLGIQNLTAGEGITIIDNVISADPQIIETETKVIEVTEKVETVETKVETIETQVVTIQTVADEAKEAATTAEAAATEAKEAVESKQDKIEGLDQTWKAEADQAISDVGNKQDKLNPDSSIIIDDQNNVKLRDDYQAFLDKALWDLNKPVIVDFDVTTDDEMLKYKVGETAHISSFEHKEKFVKAADVDNIKILRNSTVIIDSIIPAVAEVIDTDITIKHDAAATETFTLSMTDNAPEGLESATTTKKVYIRWYVPSFWCLSTDTPATLVNATEADFTKPVIVSGGTDDTFMYVITESAINNIQANGFDVPYEELANKQYIVNEVLVNMHVYKTTGIVTADTFMIS